VRAGNLYVNRNMVGAVVGVQPFGGLGLSGTGPKAGGPLTLQRLRRHAHPPRLPAVIGAGPPPALASLQAWAKDSGHTTLAGHCAALTQATPLLQAADLPGPTGESNRLRYIARGRALCVADDEDELLRQVAAALATGNRVALCAPCAESVLARLPEPVQRQAVIAPAVDFMACEVALCTPAQAVSARRALAAGDGARVRLVTPEPAGGYPLEALVTEQVLTVNTAAAGGNAGLMTLAPA
jgi:RHH-type proline utilization regulon transcriptional repressor/proline dehydrogenase/delta 1-pyrroline-5-carboxylate dehydrogenase